MVNNIWTPEWTPVCECPHNDGSERLLLNWEEFLSLKAHYKSSKYSIMRQGCEDYRRGEHWVVEESETWKVIRYK